MIISKLKLSRRQLNLHLCPIVVQSQILKKWSYKMVVNKTYEKVSFNLPTDIKSEVVKLKDSMKVSLNTI